MFAKIEMQREVRDVRPERDAASGDQLPVATLELVVRRLNARRPRVLFREDRRILRFETEEDVPTTSEVREDVVDVVVRLRVRELRQRAEPTERRRAGASSTRPPNLAAARLDPRPALTP